MHLRSATTLALALGLAAFSSNAIAASHENKSDAPAALPGNVGGEGAAGAVAREKGLIEAEDNKEAVPMSEVKETPELPGNVGGEGAAGNVADPALPAYGERKDVDAGTPVEKRLPGNVAGEGSGKTK